MNSDIGDNKNKGYAKRVQFIKPRIQPYDNSFSWSPPGLANEDLIIFFDGYPEDKIPFKTSKPDDSWRFNALAYQMPKKDISALFCPKIQSDWLIEHKYKEFVQNRNFYYFDVGLCVKNSSYDSLKCRGCSKLVEKNSFYIQSMLKFIKDTDTNFQDYVWHPECFKCLTCNDLLADLAYCFMKNKLYCLRHFDDACRPRCYKCDELIFNSEYTRGMNQNFHTDHFSCWNCDQSLTGSRYILKDEHPYCIKCYETLFAHNCELCKSKIGTDSKDLSYKDMHWHEKCFFCCLCNIKLVDKPFGYKNDRLYCGECYNQTFASRCDKCAQIFKPGMKKMEYKGQQFHENCFLCFTCNLPIGTKSFIPKENKIYCVPCYEQNFATKCNKCTKVISQGGVSYKNQPFHRECFTCTNCQQSLAGQRFTSRDEHPYCSDCFGKLFAKKCYSCHKPITVNPDLSVNTQHGIGGTKYISFEDRHWHNECFVCNQCHTSLVGRGFLTDAMDILCPDCGRN